MKSNGKKWFSAALIGSATLGAIVPPVSADYDSFAQGLEDSSAQVNALGFSPEMYTLDAETARAYFTRYFRSHRLTEPLRVNLNYPLLFWGSNQRNLQIGFFDALLHHLSNFVQDHPAPEAINAACAADVPLMLHLVSMLRGFDYASHVQSRLSPTEKAAHLAALVDVLETSGLATAAYAHIDNALFPALNPIKTQMVLSPFVLAKHLDNWNALKELVRLSGNRAVLFQDYNVLLLDNAVFSEQHVGAVVAFFAALPRPVRQPIGITVWDFLGSPETAQRVGFFSGAINVFGFRVGQRASNAFPNDYPVVPTDTFLEVLAHEFGHSLGNVMSEPLVTLSARLNSIAGRNHNNYLRSMFSDGFFQTYPQEFLASICNMYLTSSRDTFRYALQKYVEGNANQISQFCLLASIFSDSGQTHFMRMNSYGEVTSEKWPVTLSDSFLQSLVLDGHYYVFSHTDGVVTRVVGNHDRVVRGDLDGDDVVDRNDLDLVVASRNQPAVNAEDPRDLDGDGMITVLDARILVTLFSVPGGLLHAASSPDGVVLEWAQSAGAMKLQSTADLQSGTWQDVEGLKSSTNAVIGTSAERMFFRLVLPD
jgi:hypothetical protein